MPEPEIEAMASVADALSALDSESQSRVLRWAAEKYGVSIQIPLADTGRGTAVDQARTSSGVFESDREREEAANVASRSTMNGSPQPASAHFDHFADLFEAVQPKTELEKAMAAGYWEQVIRGRSEWQSATINNELKNIGHYISNINKVLDRGMAKKPAPVLQLKKSGTTQQARRTYKLSHEGIKLMTTRLAQNS